MFRLAASNGQRKPSGFEYKPSAGSTPYSLSKGTAQSKSAFWEIAGVATGITALGIADWDQGTKFRFRSEGFFGRDTGSLGMDKVGHAFSAYLITELITRGIERRAADPSQAEITAGLISFGLMTYVEVFDGFASDHGFSHEDLVADAAGAAFSLLRSSVPGMRQKVDFRLQYIPSGNVSGFHPITDYSGQRYLMALKLNGFDRLAESPLRFVELHAGYYARGFTRAERLNGERRRRMPFVGVGVGLNVQELIFGHRNPPRSKPGQWAKSAINYLQIPFTAVHSK